MPATVRQIFAIHAPVTLETQPLFAAIRYLPISVNSAPPFDADAGALLRAETPSPSLVGLQSELQSLYVSHFGKVCGYFVRTGRTRAEAQDLAQEVFVNALRGLALFRGQSKLSTWLWTIARNVLLAHVRTPAATDFQALDELGQPICPDTLANTENDDHTEVGECVRRGFAAFHRDHPDRAQVLYLAIVEGWTRPELAEFLGRTPHAATEYLSQCRSKFKPYIESCCDD